MRSPAWFMPPVIMIRRWPYIYSWALNWVCSLVLVWIGFHVISDPGVLPPGIQVASSLLMGTVAQDS